MILLSYGTRPEYIKLLPLIKEFKKENLQFKLVQIGQHTSLLNDDYDDRIAVFNKPNRLDSIISSVLAHGEHLYKGISTVIVQGDTSSAMAVALGAFHRNILVCHIEAGLRTYDKENPYPEETNRRIISSIASIHFCPTKRDKVHLIVEGFEKDTIVVTGNTAIDNLKNLKPKSGKEVIITMHRRENLGDLNHWFSAIEELAQIYTQYKFVCPAHPNPLVQYHAKEIFKKVRLIQPLEHSEMLERIANCKLVITDSGGIQEECSWFKKLCFVCRLETERPCKSGVICRNSHILKDNFRLNHKRAVTEECPFGDGNAARKITEQIFQDIYN
jgi:UDP-N-acetylglucosamine 2-epimerase (non-hydrolysing)